MKEYLLHKKAGIGPCMDVRGYEGRIYAIQRQDGGRLFVLTPDLSVISVYGGIGNARQIEIKDGIAAISAREDGLWLFDVRDPEPVLLCHYRTVEFATGITLYRNFVLVSCRQFGVEIIDIADLRNPRYVGVIRIGEAQSACVYGDVLYAGVWGEMKVVAVDISDIENPRRLADLPLTGRGDGVVVRDGILYAVTGQHRRGIRNPTDEKDPDFGMGNGIEVYDVRDPACPKHLSWDFFARGYAMSYDMWKPMLCGDALICNDSILGVYGYDAGTMERRFHLSVPAVDGEPDAVTGTAAHGGRLYVSTGYGGVYVFDEMEFAEGYRYDREETVRTEAPAFRSTAVGGGALVPVYVGDFPVLSACETEGYGLLALACGDKGIRLWNPETAECVAAFSRGCFCYDVAARGDLICGAFGERGVCVLRFDGTALTLLSASVLERSVQQIALTEQGQFAVITCGGSAVKMLDLRDPVCPQTVCEYTGKGGILYGENFLAHSIDGKGISLFWHREGLVHTDPEGGDREFHRVFYPMKKGFTGYCPGNGCDVDGEKILFVRRGGYILLPKDGRGYADELPVYRGEDAIRGKLCAVGNALIATERAEGEITVTDISDIERPRLISRIETNASPSMAVETSHGIFIPGRYMGLLRLTF